MKRWGAIYLAWILGVLSAAALAYWYWVNNYGEELEGDGTE